MLLSLSTYAIWHIVLYVSKALLPLRLLQICMSPLTKTTNNFHIFCKSFSCCSFFSGKLWVVDMGRGDRDCLSCLRRWWLCVFCVCLGCIHLGWGCLWIFLELRLVLGGLGCIKGCEDLNLIKFAFFKKYANLQYTSDFLTSWSST